MCAMSKFPYTLAALCALLSACSQPQPVISNSKPGSPYDAKQRKEQTVQRQYLALPGQSAVRVGTEDADDAFDRQVEAYANASVASAAQQSTDPIASHITEAGTFPSSTRQDTSYPEPRSAATEIPDPVQPPLGGTIVPATAAVPEAPTPEIPTDNTVQGTADYAVQITNGTAGRIFVEAQDAAGHIFPCGPMFGGQSINTPPDPIGPLKGPITVVVRDPDKDGAPEIRRYQVQAPLNYKGKTVGITILPGGQYRADVDKEVYYTSPAPEKPAEATAPETR